MTRIAILTADEPDSALLYHPGYPHNCCDAEFTWIAQARDTFAFAPDSIVEHLHHVWGKGEDDAVYARGRETTKPTARCARRAGRLDGVSSPG